MSKRIKCLLSVSTLFLVIPSFCMAYTIVLKDESNIPENEIHAQVDTQISYSGTNLHLVSKDIKNIKLESLSKKDNKLIGFVKDAEASNQSTNEIINAFVKARRTIKYAKDIDDLKPAISHSYLRNMNVKAKNAEHEIVVIEMMRNLSPDEPLIVNWNVDGDQAKIVTQGHSFLGDLQGVITMVKEEGVWKIQEENWYGENHDGIKKAVPISSIGVSSIIEEANQAHKPTAFSLVEKGYRFDRNHLKLRTSKVKVNKQAFMFMFFVDKDKKNALKEKEERQLLEAEEKKRARVHLVWTGPSLVVPEQKMFEDTANMDVSIADEDDGYLPQNVNVRLPKKKPKEILAGFVMNF